MKNISGGIMEENKNKNLLCDKWYSGNRGLNYVLDFYNSLLEQKEELIQRKKDFEEKVNSEDEKNVGKLKFKEKKYIYDLINNMFYETEDNDEKWKLGSIRNHLKGTFEDLEEYYTIIENLDKVNESLSEIHKYINFNNFKNEESYKTCIKEHFLVRLEDEIYCMRCGETTKNYNLTKEELDFLTFCAEKQNSLIGRLSEEEIPLIKVLMVEHQYYRDHRTPISEIPEVERLDYKMEYSMVDEAELEDIKRELNIARALDSGDFYNDKIKLINPAYLSGSRMNELYKEIEQTIEEIENSDSQYKDLLLEQCAVAQYELYILNGYRIPRLLNDNDLDKKIALVKAYYNLSNSTFRLESGYFEPSPRNFDALAYPCRTANSEINQMILDLKLKR